MNLNTEVMNEVVSRVVCCSHLLFVFVIESVHLSPCESTLIQVGTNLSL